MKPIPIRKTDETRWAEKIRASLERSVGALIETGRLLSHAKKELGHGRFLDMVKAELPFSARTAQRLMSIAENPALSNTTNPSHLPNSLETLYELSRYEPDELETALGNHRIKADSTTEQVVTLRKALRRGTARPRTRTPVAPPKTFLVRLRQHLADVLPTLDALDDRTATALCEAIRLTIHHEGEGRWETPTE